ncbi:MAG TPA: hypothetical protein VE869_18225 [Gemmatimonas sp.]|nr:hypothetical protein [Gemmatimonas sp.]
MSEAAASPHASAPPNAGALRWLAIQNDLVSGLAHALSNRVATIDAAAYMLQFDSTDIPAQATILHGEAGRLETLVLALRSLPARRQAEAEPVLVADVVKEALAVHEHHDDLRGIPCETSIDPDVPPVHVDPIALQHALLVALTAARTAAGSTGVATLDVRAGGDMVQFTASARGAPGVAPDGGESDAAAISWLLHPHGGESDALPDGCAFRVRTLEAARRAGR